MSPWMASAIFLQVDSPRPIPEVFMESVDSKVPSI